jgi:hypothetical protein
LENKKPKEAMMVSHNMIFEITGGICGNRQVPAMSCVSPSADDKPNVGQREHESDNTSAIVV